ncbi:MAG: cytidylyltransferase family protein [Thermofilaceae archaeon]|nr:cytidylyltransferase family protein [Thermofilaceae archaeon]MCX8180219.1 cytidylyltransferase family protein [Thermofilaceae archaeon]MDW8003609.1 DUF357 domain-containing protein [Thermofilaceae archaeon]
MNAEERAKKYIDTLHAALRNLVGLEQEEVAKVVKLAISYLNDAEFYLERGDALTSVACSSYAEGLLDALNLLGKASITWPKSGRKTVLVGGVFEIVHPGHIYMLRQARQLGKVIVIVARDSTVQKLKGRPPVVPEDQRLEVVASIRYVDEAYLGNDPLDVEGILRKFNPDFVLLGPDQNNIEVLVKRALEHLGLQTTVVKMEERVEGKFLSSSEIIKRARSLNV